MSADTSAAGSSADMSNDEEIARVAYGIWEAEGQPEGCEYDHWMRARQMVEHGRAQATNAEGHFALSVEEVPGGAIDDDPRPLASETQKRRKAKSVPAL